MPNDENSFYRGATQEASLSAPRKNTYAQGYLGRLIACRRAERGMSLFDVAVEAHSTKPHIWALEHGKTRNPGAELIFGLAVALDCRPEDVLHAAIADMPGATSHPLREVAR